MAEYNVNQFISGTIALCRNPIQFRKRIFFTAHGNNLIALFAVQDQAARDPEYLALLAKYRVLSPKLLELLDRLPRQDADIVEDYLGLTAQMHRKLPELACKEKGSE